MMLMEVTAVVNLPRVPEILTFIFKNIEPKIFVASLALTEYLKTEKIKALSLDLSLDMHLSACASKHSNLHSGKMECCILKLKIFYLRFTTAYQIHYFYKGHSPWHTH